MKGLWVKLILIVFSLIIIISVFDVAVEAKVTVTKETNEFSSSRAELMMVQFKETPSNYRRSDVAVNVLRSLNLEDKVLQNYAESNSKLMRLSSQDVEKLRRSLEVANVRKQETFHTLLQDSIPLIGADEVWPAVIGNTSLTGHGQTVCIIDTGLDYKHSVFGNCTIRYFETNGTITNLTEAIESDHPYAINTTTTWTISEEGYESIAVFFESIILEPGFDYIEILDSNNNTIQEITGYQDNIWSVSVPGDTLRVRLISDELINDYGFRITQVLNGTSEEVIDYNSCPTLVGGIDFVNEDNDPFDDEDHGTHVAGIVKGVAPDAKFAIVKSLDSNGDGIEPNIIAGIEWCVDNKDLLNITVISMSLGTITNYPSTCDGVMSAISTEINRAVSNNISVVIATGNNGNSTGLSAPACIASATRVTSTTKSDVISSFSNRNSLVSLTAPGSFINSTYLNNTYAILSGTSMAAPHVAGAYALFRQYYDSNNIKRTPYQIETLLNNTGVKVFDVSSGRNYSRIDVLAAFQSLGIADYELLVSSPQNISYTTNNLSLSYSFNSEGTVINSCMYKLDSAEFVSIENCTNTSLINLTEGERILTLRVNLSLGEEIILLEENISFTIDTQPPVVTLSGFPINNTAIARNTTIRINATDVVSEIDSFRYRINLEDWINTTQNLSFIPFNETLTTVNVSFTIFANDTLGNTYSETYRYTIDNTVPNEPSIEFNPTNNENEFLVTIDLALNLSDDIGSGYRRILMKHNDNVWLLIDENINGKNHNLMTSYNATVGNNNFTFNITDSGYNSIIVERNVFFNGLVNSSLRLNDLFNSEALNFILTNSSGNELSSIINTSNIELVFLNTSLDGINLVNNNLNVSRIKWYRSINNVTLNLSTIIDPFRTFLGASATSLSIANYSTAFPINSYDYIIVSFNSINQTKAVAYYLADTENTTNKQLVSECIGSDPIIFSFPCYKSTTNGMLVYIQSFSTVIASEDTTNPSVSIINPSTTSERDFQPELMVSADVVELEHAIMDYNGVNETAAEIILFNATHSRILFNAKTENHETEIFMSFYINDSADNLNDSISLTTIIDDTIKANISSMSPTNNTFFNSETLNLAISFTEPVSVVINDSNQVINCTSSGNNASCIVSYESNLNKTLYLTAIDLANNMLQEKIILTRSYSAPVASSSTGGGGGGGGGSSSGTSPTTVQTARINSVEIKNNSISFIFANFSLGYPLNIQSNDSSTQIEMITILSNQQNESINITYTELENINISLKRSDNFTYEIIGNPFYFESNNSNSSVVLTARLVYELNNSEMFSEFHLFRLNDSEKILSDIYASNNSNQVIVEVNLKTNESLLFGGRLSNIIIEEPIYNSSVSENLTTITTSDKNTSSNNNLTIIIVIVLSLTIIIVSMLYAAKKLVKDDS